MAVADDARYRSRKWQIAVGALIVAWLTFLIGYPWHVLTAEQILDFTKWGVGLYMLGNVGDTAAERLRAPA